MITTIQVTGMTCENCVRHVREALEAVPGVQRAEVDLASGQARVEGSAPADALLAAVREEDYEATLA